MMNIGLAVLDTRVQRYNEQYWLTNTLIGLHDAEFTAFLIAKSVLSRMPINLRTSEELRE